MKRRANLRHFLIIARGMDAIGEQHNKKFAVRIDPDGSAGKAGVAKTMRRKKVAAGAAFGGNRPAESARAAGKLLRRGELSDRRAAQDAMMRIAAAV